MTAQNTAGVENVTVTIDGVEVSVPKGSLIIRAAEQVGIEIPRFCDHPLLDPAGACRQCLVDVAMPGRDGEVRKMPKPQAACTMTVMEGMEVQTQQTSPVAKKAQEGVMEFLLINHPLDCPVCDKGGECPLQNQAMSTGRPVSRFTDIKRTYSKPVGISAQVLLDRERCVLCQRCTRFSDQIAGDPFIALVERGAQQQIGIFQDQPFQSYFSGNTVQICPVGALTGAMYRFRSRPFDLVSTPSTCEHCAAGCAQRTDHRRGVVLRRMAANDPVVNEEWNCDKGRWAFQYGAASDRIEYPLVRDASGQLREASWPEALAVAADGLSAALGRSGAGILPGGRLTREDAYAYGKFARVVAGTNDIDFRARQTSEEESNFLASSIAGRCPAEGALTYTDLENATSVLLVGLEPEDECPMVFLRLRKAARKKGLKVYSIAPFASRGLEKMFGTLIEAAPGTEAEVIEAMSTGHPDLGKYADIMSKDAIILVGERLAGVTGALSTVRAFADKIGARLAWIPRRAGERSALEAGALGSVLPGGRPILENIARSFVQNVWQITKLPTNPGRSTGQILRAAAHGELDALLVGGVELADLPETDVARTAMERAFVVSLEIRRSDVTDLADVVFPVSAIAERNGTFVNWEGRPRQTQASLNSRHMADHRVLDMLATEMGHEIGTATLELVRNELAEFDPWSGPRAPFPAVAPIGLNRIPAGDAILATWRQLLDLGRMQDGDPFLADTARDTVARLSAGTASTFGVTDGDYIKISTDTGSIELPLIVTDMVDNVVWVPANSGGSQVHTMLGASAGDVVHLAAGEPKSAEPTPATAGKEGVA
ncbi:NADH-quinone oxidoreductase chain 3 [Dermatophilus congolensis]|uniref:NADH-quinone oxidoreductase n=1 Tax=Dermatophilus congolensis TaxID=1863 RepID=A0A239VR94_9MICO|nr:NADH-quinone oxidoreductase subunit G [Dermatophilus congolensis]SNV24805.1 NADH-quinone oxidoreductase chain 3 [Dermatophilus congolensis]